MGRDLTLTTLCTAALALLLVVGAQAAEKAIWQIGQFDNNYAEFAAAGDTGKYKAAFPDGVSFHVGKDDPAKAWPYIQPGPDDAWGGRGPHPSAIVFDLASEPKGVFALTIDFIAAHRYGPPNFEVSINGMRGARQLSRGPGDDALTDASKGREEIFTLQFSPSLLRKGENTITLTSLTGSWAIYDALRLTNDPEASLPPLEIRDLTVVPTTRVVRDGDKLKRYVKITAHLSRGMMPTDITLSSDSGSQRATAPADINGLVQQDILIDEQPKPVDVAATLACENATKAISTQVATGRPWKLYILPAAHVDIGYTDYQERVAQVHNNNVSHALDLCAKYPWFKWNTEAAWVEDNYLSMMPESRKAEFVERAKEGRIGCSAVYASMLTGICSHEAFVRDLYYSHNTAEKLGIPWDMAVSCDVPTFVWTLPSILAGSGIRYFAGALNYSRDDISKRPMNRPFYWEGPDGARVLTWYSPVYGWAWRLGLTTSLQAAEPKVDDFMRQFDKPDYACDSVLAYGCVEDNRSFPDAFATAVDEWNKRYVSPQVILCRGPEFFQDIEKNWRGTIPVVRGDCGVCWEDGAASTAIKTGLARCATEDLVTAEKLNALTTTFGKPACAKSEFDAAWKNVNLWNEHTWGAGSSYDDPEGNQTKHQWMVKQGYATDLARQTKNALGEAAGALAALISTSEPSIIVYNPLSWPTSGLVKPNGMTFRAENVPALGCRVYPIKNLPKLPPSHATWYGKNIVLANKYYTLEAEPGGAIRSLRDNALNRELLDQDSLYSLNEYIYFAKAGSNDPKDVTHADGITGANISVETHPEGKAMIIKTAAYNTPSVVSEILLRDDEKRIDITNTIEKTETMDKESGFFAFPFKLSKPRFHIELPDGILRPDTDTMPGACMEWYCSQDFIAVENDGLAVTWTAINNPLATLSTPNCHYGGHRERVFDKGHIYAYAFTNIWGTNYKASQGGRMTFRYSLTSSSKYDPVQSAHFGRSVRHPLITIPVAAQPKAKSAKKTVSLCSVSPANVEIQTMKQAESGNGLILRLRELSGHATTATVAFRAVKLKSAMKCNLVEDPQGSLKLTGSKIAVPLKANGLATVNVELR